MSVQINGTNGLIDLFSEWFECKDGKLVWKKDTYRKHTVGKEAGSSNGRYLQVKLLGKKYMVHRVVFALHHGYMPEFIDHINGNTIDNRIENLREASAAQNNHNRSVSARNKSGVKGVSFCNQMKKWKAQITLQYKQMHLGYFEMLSDAEAAVKTMREKLHGNFAFDGVR